MKRDFLFEPSFFHFRTDAMHGVRMEMKITTFSKTLFLHRKIRLIQF